MINQEIIKIPISRDIGGENLIIPSWIKNNAGWWADGQISDADFVFGIKHLVEQGIIRV